MDKVEEVTEEVTVEDCRKNLREWLERAAINPVFNKYDKLCHKAYELLSGDEYDKIYKSWASDYVSCPDGYYRRWR